MAEHVIDLEGLRETLSKKLDFPDGQLHQLCIIEGVPILMWDFKNFISCRKAARENFVHVKTGKRLYSFDKPLPLPSPSPSLPFFILNDEHGDVFHDAASQVVKESYVYPEVSESVRKNAFSMSLKAHNYNVNRIEATKAKYHFCQFSGGGDLYITRDTSFLVVITDDDNSPPMEPCQASPLSSSDSKLISLSIETKKQDCSLEQLRYQLWANIFLITVEKFTESLSFTTKENLLQLDRLTGYGMACGGTGVIGAYKLEIDLTSSKSHAKYVTKLELGSRDRIQAASLMDFIVNYFHKLK